MNILILTGRFGIGHVKCAEAIAEEIYASEPDLIISNLPVCSKYFSAYKELRICTQPLFTYITDITVHDEWIANKTTLYFVGMNPPKTL